MTSHVSLVEVMGSGSADPDLILSKESESLTHPETRTITASGGLKTCRRSHTWRRFDFGVLKDFLRKDELSQSAALLSRS